MKFIQKFVELCRNEDGAVTIEYVALAAVVGGLGTLAYNILSGALATGTTISFS